MVVFEDGLPRKSEYRRFVIRSVDGQNDVASMHEVITRRFRRLLDEQARSTEVATESGPMLVDPETGRPRKFAYAPGLVVVDGGPPQVAAAQAALRELGRRRHPGLRAGQAARGGVAARPGGPGDHGPRRRRASTCSSGSATRRTGSRSPTTGRAVQDDGREHPRRRARTRRGPPPGPGQALRLAQEAPGGRGRGDRAGARASGRGRPWRSRMRWPARPARLTARRSTPRPAS